MAEPILDDDLWALIEPLLPPPNPQRFRHPGRKTLDDRAVLTGILFVLQSGIPWEMLPKEMGCGSGMSCWRRLHAWQHAGVWEHLHEVLLAKLRAAERIDWSRVVVDSSSIREVGSKTGPTPTDRGYDHDKYRKPLHAAGIATEIARRGEPHGSGLGKTRWVGERTFAWLHNFRRLRVRFVRLAIVHEAFMKIACCIICWRNLQNSFC
ncbi:transposase [Pandoraea horticolens]|uniref:Transposase n=1 Tax=Pandoraea horticolens TaxID=2508298 RepID=A0A5E4UN78_9BURK|nr:transposase [Pandoraea horticolens]VVE01003.1 transposase [Pandoraea horticolens]